MRKLVSVIAILSLVFAPVTPSFATERKWLGISPFGDEFSYIGNWWGSRPNDGDALLFSTAISGRDRPKNDYVGYTFSGITFRDAAKETEVRGNSIYLSGDINNSSYEKQYISLDMELLKNVNLYSGDAAYDLEVDGIISGGYGISKTGTSTLILGGVNTYTGATTITQGTLTLDTTGKIESSAGVANGGTFEIQGSKTIGYLSGTGTTTLGANTLTITGTGTYSGIASGTGGFTMNKAGKTLTLSGANTYSGTTTINAGTLRIASGTGLGSTAGGTTVANGATLDLAGTFAVGNEAVTLASGSTLSSSSGTNSISGAFGITGTSTVDVATSLTLSGAIIGSNVNTDILAKTGAGTLVLSGNADNLNTSATVNGGILSLEKTSANAVGHLTLTSGTVRLNGTNDCQIWDSGTVTLNGGTFDQNGKNETIGTLVLKGGAITGAGTLTSSSTIDAQSGSSSTILAGSVGLTKTTSGTVTLSGANTYTGGTTISTGVVSATTSAEALGTGAVTVASGAALQLTGALDFNEALTIRGTGVSSGGVVRHISGNTNYSGVITLGAASRINSDADTLTLSGATIDEVFDLTFGGAGNTTISGILATGAKTLTKDGTGTLTLSGINTYTGATTVAEGSLKLDFSAAGAASDIIKNTSALVLSGGDLLLTGKGSTVNSQTVNGLTLSAGNSEITLTANGATSLVLNLRNIADPAAGATINFTLPTGTQDATNGITTTRANDASGILGAWATVTTAGGTEWAVSGGNGVTAGNITAYAGYTSINAYGGRINIANSNVRIQTGGAPDDGDITLAASDRTINTLLQDSDTIMATVDTGGYTLKTNGIMISSGAESLVIGDIAGGVGTLTSATAGGALVLNVSNANSILTINSFIANNTSASALTKSGDGTLDLNAVNTYTGATTITAGILNLRQSLTSSSGLIFSGDVTVNLASGKTLGCSVTTEDDGTGTLNFLGGTQSVSGDIGAAGKALKKVDVASGTTTFNGNVVATTLYFSDDGTAILASGKSITGSVRTNGSEIPQGTLTLAGGNQTVSGMIGSIQDMLKAVNVQAGTGDTATFSSTVRAQNVYITGTGTAAFGGNVLDTDVNFSADGFATLADTKDFSGDVTGSSGLGTFTLLGTHTIAGNIGSTLLGNNGLKLLTIGDVAGAAGKTVTVNGNIKALTINFAKDNELKLGSGYSLTGATTTTTNDTGTLTFLGSTSTGGNIGTGGLGGRALKAVNFNGATTLFDNIYATDTNVNSGATLTPGGGDINGNLSVLAGGTLSLGSNLMRVVGGAFSSADTSGINVDIAGGASGKIEATDAVASVDNGTKIFVNLIGNPHANQFTILESIGGIGTIPDANITDDSGRFYFTQVADTNKLILMAHPYGAGTFAADGTNANAQAVGAVFDAIDDAGATGDMLTVIDTLDALSDAQIGDALNTMYPDVSSGAAEGSRSLTSQGFTTVSNRLGGARSGGASGSGVSSGDMPSGVGVWMQALGSNMHQGERKGIQGYNANLFGTTIGADKVLDSHFRSGFAGSYGWARVKSKEGGSPSDDINSYQATIYGSYDSLDLCKARQGGKKSYEAVRSQVENSWYVDGMAAFTQNNYDSRREIWVTPASVRVAKAEHYGQQYSTNFEAGYKFVVGGLSFPRKRESSLDPRLKHSGMTSKESSSDMEYGSLEITPFVSLGYNYLYMNKYKEKGADSLNLTVQGEGFHQLEQGLGTKLAYPIVSKKMGTFIPSAKAAWLYDYIGDRFQTTASFAGGGPSFDTIGAKPAKSGMLFGAELAFLNKGNVTLTGNWDIELKDQFMSNTYYGTVRYDF
jgi:fibronectin-binding autotransporter adhesin